MKTLLFFIGVMIAFSAAAQQSTYRQTVKGTVLDEQSGNALPGVTIMVQGQQPGTYSLTNQNGYFQLDAVVVGRQTILAHCVGYEDAVLSNIEVTSSKQVVLEIKLKEKVKKLDAVEVRSGRPKHKAINEIAVVSSRQLSTDEAFRYAGTRNDPSRMAQNFAGVSGTNDGRNDIIIRGNSPTGVLWRMDGIDIPNPNHFSTFGATGGPVSMLNIYTLKNSDFLTSAFPAQYGNALAGVFDLRLRNGNTAKHEFVGQMGFNGFELGAEGPFNKKSGASYLINYRYSLLAALQQIGLSFGTGTATPYYQDITIKINLPTTKAGTFSLFALGGESHIHFLPETDNKDNLYASNDGTERDRKFKSKTAVAGLTHSYFFNSNTSAKTTLAVSGFSSDYKEAIVEDGKPNKPAFLRNNQQYKFSISHTLNKKISARQQLTAGLIADKSELQLVQHYIKDGDSVLSNLLNADKSTTLLRLFINYNYRFTDKLTANTGLYYQHLTLNNSQAIEPRFNIKLQLSNNQSLALGAGMHSQTQPLDVYFYKSTNSSGQIEYTNQQLDFVKSLHGVLGYDITPGRQLRFKAELYAQYIYNAAVEKTPSSFSLLNAGSDFGFPDKTNLVNNGRGYNYGIEITAERFLHRGLYYLFTASLFQSKYKGSDDIWRNTAFNSNYVVNALAGKEMRINDKTIIGIDSKLTVTGGQRYTPFDAVASAAAGYVIYKEKEAYSAQNSTYLRWDLKFSYIRNLKKVTQKWYIDLQNLTSRKNIYIRTLNPKTGVQDQINQMGFFPNINYQITF
ncbi:MAG: hypothetical protein RL172_2536 [Bacteroidota bacterium]